MLTIKCVQNGEPFETVLYQYISKDKAPKEVKDLANRIWKKKSTDSNVTGLMGLMPDGTVKMAENKTEMAFAIKAKFDNSNKTYTYPSAFVAESNDLLVVHSPYGIGLPKAIECRKVPKHELPAICNVKDEKHLNWVIGVLPEYQL